MKIVDFIYPETVATSDRHQDSHDILSVFNIVNDYTEMSVVPENPDELLDLLVNRHEIIMHEPPNKHPGMIKKVANKEGDSTFVLPDPRRRYPISSVSIVFIFTKRASQSSFYAIFSSGRASF